MGVPVLPRVSQYYPGCPSTAKGVLVLPRVSHYCSGCPSTAKGVPALPRVSQYYLPVRSVSLSPALRLGHTVCLCCLFTRAASGRGPQPKHMDVESDAPPMKGTKTSRLSESNSEWLSGPRVALAVAEWSGVICGVSTGGRECLPRPTELPYHCRQSLPAAGGRSGGGSSHWALLRTQLAGGSHVWGQGS